MKKERLNFLAKATTFLVTAAFVLIKAAWVLKQDEQTFTSEVLNNFKVQFEILNIEKKRSLQLKGSSLFQLLDIFIFIS